MPGLRRASWRIDLPALGVALGRDRAGVDDAQVGRLVVGRVAIAGRGQRLAHELGLVLVDLAAERDGFERRHGGVRTACESGAPGTRSRTSMASGRAPIPAPARWWPTSSPCSSDQRILAEGVDLVALQLGVLAGGGEHDRPAAGVDFLGDLKALFHRVAEQLLHHGDHVLERVVVVVPEDDVVARLPLGLLCLASSALSSTVCSTGSATPLAIRLSRLHLAGNPASQ